jgi:hypothetical protein
MNTLLIIIAVVAVVLIAILKIRKEVNNAREIEYEE